MIKLDLSKESLENEEVLKSALNTALYTQLSNNGTSIACLVENRIAKYESKKEFNLHKPLIDDSTDTFIGELPDITTRAKSELQKTKIANFRQKLYEEQFATEIFKVGKDCSTTGVGYLLAYHDLGDTFTHFKHLDPRYTNVVVDCSVAEKPLFAFNVIEIITGSGATMRRKYRVYAYTDKNIYAYETNARTTFTSLASFSLRPYNCFSLIGLQATEYVNTVPHNYSSIPLVEFDNNETLCGDTECVDNLIELYYKLQKSRVANVEDIINYVLMIKNARLGNEEEQKDVVDMLNNNHILALEGEGADAKFLSNPLNQNEIETLAKSIKDNIHYICRIPDLSSVDFSQNASDPIIKIKTKPLLDLCKEKEMFFTKSLLKVLKMALDFVLQYNDKANDFKFDFDKVSLKYSHTLPSNDLDATNMLVNLNNSGMASPRDLLENIKAIGNVDDYMNGMKEWNEYVDNRKNNKENNNKVVNETNLERQNSKFVSSSNRDNLNNATLGDSQKISDNKVTN